MVMIACLLAHSSDYRARSLASGHGTDSGTHLCSASEEVNLYIEVHMRRCGVHVNIPTLEEPGPGRVELSVSTGGRADEEGDKAPSRPKAPPPKQTAPLFQD